MSPRSGGPTIHDVAKAAKVSPATAGRALGGYGFVSSQVRERVLAAAAEIGYRPNNLARSMITGQTQTVGVIGADIENPFFSRAMRGIGDEARRRGYGTILTNSDESLEVEQDALQMLLRHRVDGLIVAPADIGSVDHLKEVAKTGTPLVLLDRRSSSLRADSVTTDNADVAAEAVGDLIALGHKRILTVVEITDEHFERWFGDQYTASRVRSTAAMTPSALRLYGYLHAHEAAGLRVDPRLICRVPRASAEDAAELTADRVRSGVEATAVFATDDFMSVGAFEGLRKARVSRRRMPAFVAFDDSPWTRLVEPQVSVVEQPVYDMGVRAAALLFDRIDGARRQARHVVLPGTYVQRATSTPPSSS